MRKSLFYVVLALVAMVTSACGKNEYPTNIQGTWLYDGAIAGIQSTLSTSSSSASKGIPATITFVNTDPVQDFSTKVLVNYDPSDGEGSFKPEKGEEGLHGFFEAIDKLNIKLTLIHVSNKGEETTLLEEAIYSYKQDINNN